MIAVFNVARHVYVIERSLRWCSANRGVADWIPAERISANARAIGSPDEAVGTVDCCDVEIGAADDIGIEGDGVQTGIECTQAETIIIAGRVESGDGLCS